MMATSDALERGRAAYGAQAWLNAAELLREADRESQLDADDLVALGTAAFLVGDDAVCTDALGRAYQSYVEDSAITAAARCVFWLNFAYDNRGEHALAQGWLARGERLLDEHGLDCVERGYFRMAHGIGHFGNGDVEAAVTDFDEVIACATRFGDRDLLTFGQMGRGHGLALRGQRVEGFALIDELMIAVTRGEVSPLVIGQMYCAVIETCHEFFELKRAAEWTKAMTDWCESHAGQVAYRGECLLYRSEILQVHGQWQEAIDDADRARERLKDPPGQSALATAHYRRAELSRLRGDLGAAEVGYRQASRLGKQPEPGLALLRLAQGQTEAAASILRRALHEAGDAGSRCRLLPAYIEIMLEARDQEAARSAAEELRTIAESLDAPFVRAEAAHALGAVLLAEGQSLDALAQLRAAATLWQEVSAPYEAARTRALISRCCRALGDAESAAIELDAARWALEQLGAHTDLRRLEAEGRPADASGLTPRELEVLRLMAAGVTNRAIANELIISEKTVARHVSNIFTKLDVPSRSAATAYAYEHKLV